MPVVGYLLLLNRSVLELADIDQRFKLFATESPWRLIAVYYGTFLLGIASTLYLVICPREIRRYDSAVDYIRAEQDHYSVAARRERLEQAVALAAPDAKSRGEHVAAYVRTFEQIHGHGVMAKEKPSYIDQLMEVNWHVQNVYAPRWRMWAWAAFCAGFLLLLVPSVVTFAEVSLHVAALTLGVAR